MLQAMYLRLLSNLKAWRMIEGGKGSLTVLFFKVKGLGSGVKGLGLF
jgi:hypothetical protein